MATEWICDGCGKRAAGVPGPHGRWLKPHDWFERSDDEGIQSACSRQCVDKIAEATGKSGLVLPL